ncbi:hypothetical protein F5Y01DRAFT_232983 [Xylaria sp. FL0043]|nr:hypothetical protein F5Y01DRAFT_232983 [Xylaria sp. FL0043]
MTQSIATHVTQCLNLFRDGILPPGVIYKHSLEDQLSQKVRDEYTRFKVWSGNIGAHHDGMSSLDYRLRDSSHIRDHVVRLLQDLESLLEDVTAILKGEKIPWDQLSGDEDSGGSDNDDGDDDDYDASRSERDSPDTELNQLTLDVADVINCLLRMSMAIRSPSRHDRFVGSKSTETSHFEPFDIHHVQSKFPTIDLELSQRLGRAITRRRQYFKYREAHYKKLSYGLEDDGNLDLAPETIASSIPDHLKIGRDGSEPVVMNLADGSSESGFSQTSYALSTADPEQRLVPPLPEEAAKGPFQCPFCFMIVIITNRSLWKRHVYGDLRPYICLVKNCKTPEKDFTRRHEWIQHMQDNHWKTYKCPFACDTTFISSSDCKDHVIRNHPGMAALGQRDDLIELGVHAADPSLTLSCPLCPETLRTGRQYQRHVGRHQEQLALFALPNLNYDKEQNSDKSEAEGEDEGYCLCNRVSFGTMIQCDNIDNCEKEWFHLECVGLSEVPGRTTKWYCPQCRSLLNIEEPVGVTSDRSKT